MKSNKVILIPLTLLSIFIIVIMFVYMFFQSMSKLGPEWCDENSENYIKKKQVEKDIENHREEFLNIVDLLSNYKLELIYSREDHSVSVLTDSLVPLGDFNQFTEIEKETIKSFMQERNAVEFKIDTLEETIIIFTYWKNVTVVYSSKGFDIRKLGCSL